MNLSLQACVQIHLKADLSASEEPDLNVEPWPMRSLPPAYHDEDTDLIALHAVNKHATRMQTENTGTGGKKIKHNPSDHANESITYQPIFIFYFFQTLILQLKF